MVTIFDDQLKVCINEIGATLTSIRRLKDNREFLWQGSEDSWNEQDVVIFPFVARQKDGWYSIDGKRYEMPLHGLCTHARFVADMLSESDVVLSCQWDDETYKMYPFKYEYSVRFKIKNGKLIVTHTAKNLDDKLMYFMMGAHPGFNVCATYENGIVNTDGNFIDFLEPVDFNYFTLEEKGHFITGETKFGTVQTISTGKDIMKKYKTIMLTNPKVSKLVLRLADGENIYFDFGKVSVLAFWSMEDSGEYICIEPWFGAPDRLNPARELQNKAMINTLDPGKEFVYSYNVGFDE